MSHEIALSKAKIQLMSSPESTFFSTLCLSLNHEWNTKIDTACTDGLCIQYNPEFFLGLSPNIRTSVLLHETLHVALKHVLRRTIEDHTRFNIAADHAANNIIKMAKFTVPDTWYCDIKYKDMSVEAIYKCIPEGLAPPEMEDISNEVPELDPTELDNLLISAVMAAEATKGTGSIPNAIAHYVDELRNPKIPWQVILKKYFTKLKAQQYTFRKLHRRSLPTMPLPTRRSIAISEGAFAIDISASVTKEEFRTIITEVTSAVKILKPKRVDIIQFNTSIVDNTSVPINNLRGLKTLPFKKGGGTNITPVINWGNENKPDWLVIFTDGYFKVPAVQSKIPIIFIILNNTTFTSKLGKVIHYTTE